MKMATKVSLVDYSDDFSNPLGFLIDSKEFKNLSADQLREALEAGGFFVVRRPDGSYNTVDGEDQAVKYAPLGEIKERQDGSYEIVGVEVDGEGEVIPIPIPTEYLEWQDMIARCYDSTHPNYPKEGGRGIKVCDRWRF